MKTGEMRLCYKSHGILGYLAALVNAGRILLLRRILLLCEYGLVPPAAACRHEPENEEEQVEDV